MKILIFLLFTILYTVNISAQLKLPSIFSDNMVLQRKTEVPIWGWASPGSVVTVKFMNQMKSTITDDDGCWEIKLDPLDATFNQQKMRITLRYERTRKAWSCPGSIVEDAPWRESDGNKIVFTNVLVGEVWLCSGQSNMEFPIKSLEDSKEQIANANDPNIRFISINKFNLQPYECDDCVGKWEKCSPENAKEITAVGYFFAKELRKKLDVPVGLIESYFGGSKIEAWTSMHTLNNFPELQSELALLSKYKSSKQSGILKRYEKKKWYEKLKTIDTGFSNNWMNSNTDFDDWKHITLPCLWDSVNLKEFRGTLWLKKNICLPKSWINKNLILETGAVYEFDITWFNGKEVGIMQTPCFGMFPRKYKINSSEFLIGTNTITICAYCKNITGGDVGPKEAMRIYPYGEPEQAIQLYGEWSYKKGYSGKTLPEPPIPFRINHFSPAALYNSMIAPVIPFGIRGVLWYQGESNQDQPYKYRDLFTGMITDWRRNWGQNEMPFYFVQIAPNNYNNNVNAALLREAQMFALNITNTGMAVTMDIGNPNNIHPTNKKDVGYRLALWALAKDYGFTNIVFSGPIYKKMEIDGNKIILYFDYSRGLKTRDGKALSYFEIAGKDKKFVPAIAKIKNNEIIVTAKEIIEPVAVRYGWSDIAEPNLCNGAGLPASSFRTDDWK